MSKNHIISSGYKIPIDYFTDKMLFREKTKLKKKSKFADKDTGFGYSGDEEPIKCFRENSQFFIVPRMYGIREYADNDNFIDRTQEGTPIDVEWESDEGLRESSNQPEVISNMYDHLEKYHNGILHSVTGTGKTVMALKLVSMIGQTTLVLVHNEDLLQNWIDEVKTFLPGADVGLYWQDQQDYRGKDVVIGMKDTLHSRYNDLQSDFVNWPGNLIVDECVRFDSKILTEDGYIKAEDLYKKLKNGEVLYALSPTNKGLKKQKFTNFWKHKKRKSLVIKTKSGEKIPISKDHEFEIFNNDTGEKEWCKATDLNEGDFLIRPDSVELGSGFLDKPYFLGLFTGDGHFLYENKIRFSFTKDVEWWKDILSNIVNQEEYIYISENGRGDTNIIIDDPNLIDFVKSFGFTPGKKTGEIPSIRPIEKGFIWAKSYIKGLMDAEGSINEDGFIMSMVDENIIRECHRFLRLIGIKVRFSEKNRENENHSNVYIIRCGWKQCEKLINKIGFGMERKNKDFEVKKPFNTNVLSNGYDLSKFINDLFQVIPYRIGNDKFNYRAVDPRERNDKGGNNEFLRKVLMSVSDYINNIDINSWKDVNDCLVTYKEVANKTDYTVDYAHRNIDELQNIYSQIAKEKIESIRNSIEKYNWFYYYDIDPIVEINEVNKTYDFFDFEVEETHKFVCNGVNVHNCHRMGARTYSDLMFKFPAKYRWGLSATPERSDGLTDVIHYHMGDIAVSNKQHDVNPEIFMIPTGVKLDKSLYEKGGNLIFESMRTDLLRVSKRNELIMNELEKAHGSDRKIMMLTDRIDHVTSLVRRTKDQVTDSVGKLVGGMTKKQREKSKECDVIVGTFGFAKEGLDIESVDTLFLLSPHSKVEQPIGRIRRQHEEKKSTLVVDFVDNMDVLRAMAGKRKRYYEREGFEINNYAI